MTDRPSRTLCIAER